MNTLRDVYTTRLYSVAIDDVYCVAQSHASHAVMSVRSRYEFC